MIDTVIFDIGKVLAEFQAVEGMRAMGFTEGEIKILADKIFGSLWEECDRIPYSDEEIRALFKAAVPGLEPLIDIMWDNVTEFTYVFPYTDGWIDSLHDRGIKVYVLSNYGKQAFETNRKKYDFLDKVDGMVISYQEQLVKPSPEIYEILIDRYHIDRNKAVFIDDRQKNVDGAVNVGLKGLLFTGYEETSRKLNEMIAGE